jgi:hypothetical protein
LWEERIEEENELTEERSAGQGTSKQPISEREENGLTEEKSTVCTACI